MWNLFGIQTEFIFFGSGVSNGITAIVPLCNGDLNAVLF